MIFVVFVFVCVCRERIDVFNFKISTFIWFYFTLLKRIVHQLLLYLVCFIWIFFPLQHWFGRWKEKSRMSVQFMWYIHFFDSWTWLSYFTRRRQRNQKKPFIRSYLFRFALCDALIHHFFFLTNRTTKQKQNKTKRINRSPTFFIAVHFLIGALVCFTWWRLIQQDHNYRLLYCLNRIVLNGLKKKK